MQSYGLGGGDGQTAGYRDFNNLEGFTRKKMPIIFLKMFAQKSFQKNKPFLGKSQSKI